MSSQTLTRRTFLVGLSSLGLGAVLAACAPAAPTATPEPEVKETVKETEPAKEAEPTLKGEIVITSGGSQIAWEKIAEMY